MAAHFHGHPLSVCPLQDGATSWHHLDVGGDCCSLRGGQLATVGGGVLRLLGILEPPGSCPYHPCLFFGGRVPLRKQIDYRKKGTLILTSLLEDLVYVGRSQLP